MQEFLKRKESYDPNYIFTNMWFEAYLLRLCQQGYQEKLVSPPLAVGTWVAPLDDCVLDGSLLGDLVANPPHGLRTQNRNRSSYRTLLRNTRLRKEFRDLFLVRIFNFMDNNLVFNLMNKAAWDQANKTDLDIY